jgi:hypothetical protein
MVAQNVNIHLSVKYLFTLYSMRNNFELKVTKFKSNSISELPFIFKLVVFSKVSYPNT